MNLLLERYKTRKRKKHFVHVWHKIIKYILFLSTSIFRIFLPVIFLIYYDWQRYFLSHRVRHKMNLE